jgi:hypothetical protein
MNSESNNSDSDKDNQKPMKDSLANKKILDINVDFAGRRMAHNQTADDAFAKSKMSHGGYASHDNYQVTSLGAISLSSFDGGLSAKEKVAFNSREEVADFLDRLSACSSLREEDDAKPTSRSAKATRQDEQPKHSGTDWEGMFNEALCKPLLSQTSVSPPEAATLDPSFPHDTCTDGINPLPQSFFSLRPCHDNNDLSSLNLLSISDPDWLVNEAKATGIANDTSLKSLFLQASNHDESTHHEPGNTKNFHQFYNNRQKPQDIHGAGGEDNQKPAAREFAASPLDSLSAHTAQSSKSSRSHRSEQVTKEYVDEITDLDVLMGRGGRSNHHPGNHYYLALIARTKPAYENCTQKSEKTRVAQSVVDYIHQERKGRFVEFEGETGRWYVVDNKKARTKAGQALRDQNTPEARAKKREKYGC